MLSLQRLGSAAVVLLVVSCVDITAEPVDELPDASPNAAPKALLTPGSDQQVGTTVILSGEDSYDPDGDPLTYSWKEVGRRGTLFDTGPTYSLFLSQPGEHIIELTVADPAGASDTTGFSIRASGTSVQVGGAPRSPSDSPQPSLRVLKLRSVK